MSSNPLSGGFFLTFFRCFWGRVLLEKISNFLIICIRRFRLFKIKELRKKSGKPSLRKIHRNDWIKLCNVQVPERRWPTRSRSCRNSEKEHQGTNDIQWSNTLFISLLRLTFQCQFYCIFLPYITKNVCVLKCVLI